MTIESPIVSIKKSNTEIIDYVTQLENFKHLIPENAVKFEVTPNNTFKFALQGMPEFKLKIITVVPEKSVVLSSANEKTPFLLTLNLHSESEQQTQAQFIFEGNFNPMMAMMIKSPISKFLNVLIEKLHYI